MFSQGPGHKLKLSQQYKATSAATTLKAFHEERAMTPREVQSTLLACSSQWSQQTPVSRQSPHLQTCVQAQTSDHSQLLHSPSILLPSVYGPLWAPVGPCESDHTLIEIFGLSWAALPPPPYEPHPQPMFVGSHGPQKAQKPAKLHRRNSAYRGSIGGGRTYGLR